MLIMSVNQPYWWAARESYVRLAVTTMLDHMLRPHTLTQPHTRGRGLGRRVAVAHSDACSHSN